MSDQDRQDSAVDRLVEQFLKSRQDDVDARAFLERLKARRERRRILRMPGRKVLAAAAAVLLLAVGVLVALSQRAPTGRGYALSIRSLQDALCADLRPAWRGANTAAAAAVRAAREPLRELSRAGASVPGAAGRAGAWLNRALRDKRQSPDESDGPVTPHTEETNS